MSNKMPPLNDDFITAHFVEQKGIVLGRREILNSTGYSFGFFDVFAAPHNLKDGEGYDLLLPYKLAADEVGKIRQLCGHDGIVIQNAESLFAALRTGTYNGEWFIPILSFLTNVEGDAYLKENLFCLQNTGDFKGTFMMRGEGPYSHLLWSSTVPDNSPDTRYAVSRNSGYTTRHKYNEHCLITRAMRMEPA